MPNLEATTLSNILVSLQDKYGADLFKEAFGLLKAQSKPQVRPKRCRTPKPKTIIAKIRSVVHVGEYLTTRGVIDRLITFGFDEYPHSVSAALSITCSNGDGFTRTKNRWHRVS